MSKYDILYEIINADVLKLFVGLLAVVAIVLILKNKQNENTSKLKLHILYISSLSAFIIIELITYVCVNNRNAEDIVRYISFASTLSSLLLSVVAIIYAIVSNNKGEAQYKKIDMASDRIVESVDTILSKLEEVKLISSETKTLVTQGNQAKPGATMVTGNINAEKLIKDYIEFGSFTGNLALLACVYSKEKNRPFDITELSSSNDSYSWGYIVASTSLGIVITHNDPYNRIVVDNYYPGIKEILIEFINNYIESSVTQHKEFNINEFNRIKILFGITE